MGFEFLWYTLAFVGWAVVIALVILCGAVLVMAKAEWDSRRCDCEEESESLASILEPTESA